MQGFDQAYFTVIFHQEFDKIYTAFLKKTNSATTAQELTQLTFIKFWEYRSSYTFDLPAALQLNRKAKLVFIDWLRKEAYQKKLTKEFGDYKLPQQPGNKFELNQMLVTAIDQLPPVRKRVFTLAYIEGFSHREIAEMLNISVKTVEAHMFKALQQLRKILVLAAILSFITR